MAVVERVVAALDIAQSEVTMDVQVLEVNANDELEVGVDYPSDLRFSILPQGESGRVTVGDLLNLSQGKIGVGSRNDLSVALNMLQKRGKTKVLANPKIRVRNMEKASIKIGEKVPVVTTTNANGVVTESVNYQDVGLILQVEPRISLSNEVSVKVSMEVSNLKGEVKTAGGGIVYPMSTRNAETVMTARDGETQVLAGLVNQQQTRSSSGLPGLSVMGWLGSLFGGQKKTDQTTEIVLLLTPHIERSMALPSASDSYFTSGTESRVTVVPMTTQAPAPAPAAPAAPAAMAPSDRPQPIADQSPPPSYPPAALRRGDSGTVVVRVDVDATGYPSGVTLIQRSGSRDLDRAASDAVRRWRFQPAQSNGVPVPGSLEVPFDFTPQ